MPTAAKKPTSDWNGPILGLFALIYGGLLILFGVQTWLFVNWLFPGDQLLMKCLTMLCFDVLALVWAVAHTFYRFRSRGAKKWVQIAWTVTFILSLLASVLYLVIQSFFRLAIAPNINYIYVGYAISIIALVFNILALMFVLIYEYRAAHPRQDYFEEDEPRDPGQTQSTPPRSEAAAATGQSEQTFTKAEVAAMIADAVRTAQASPLAMPPLTQQANQASGNGNGHATQ